MQLAGSVAVPSDASEAEGRKSLLPGSGPGKAGRSVRPRLVQNTQMLSVFALSKHHIAETLTFYCCS